MRSKVWHGGSSITAKAQSQLSWPVDRSDYERRVAAARAQMTPDAFDAAWAAGQALTWQQAVEEALTGGSSSSRTEN
jgi:hypothetical protein